MKNIQILIGIVAITLSVAAQGLRGMTPKIETSIGQTQHIPPVLRPHPIPHHNRWLQANGATITSTPIGSNPPSVTPAPTITAVSMDSDEDEDEDKNEAGLEDGSKPIERDGDEDEDEEGEGGCIPPSIPPPCPPGSIAKFQPMDCFFFCMVPGDGGDDRA